MTGIQTITLVLSIVTLGFSIWKAIDTYNYSGEISYAVKDGTMLGGKLFILSCVLLAFIIVISTSMFKVDVIKDHTTEDIVFINNASHNKLTGGGDILGFSIDSTGHQYYYVTKKIEGGYIKKTIDAEKVMVVESDTQSPCIVYDMKIKKSSYSEKFMKYRFHRDETLIATKIIVPLGTIIKDITQL